MHFQLLVKNVTSKTQVRSSSSSSKLTHSRESAGGRATPRTLQGSAHRNASTRCGQVAAAIRQRRQATPDQMTSTNPKGHAPDKKPQTLDKGQPTAKRTM